MSTNKSYSGASLSEALEQATEYVKSHSKAKPEIGLILGSGLGVLANEIDHPVKLPFEGIPGFPVSTVEGHAGQLVLGELEGKQVIAMQGRFHYYEGYSLEQVTMPVRLMKQLGVRTVIVTNAAGGINTTFQAGDLMLITDHINFTGRNPLIGPNDSAYGVRFPDMSQAYTPSLQQLALSIAEQNKLQLVQGVYAGVVGPSYETPAEIKMLRKMGADAVGMSTVPEVIIAGHSKLDVLGISCITNMASGILDQPLSHDEVMETAEVAKESFLKLVRGIIHNMK
ncbi:purine-nucleoside phosphorylase [Bacillus horti]|uniref:Purine nucleoside phosphorylase n=1 Tax=Caldalkalibacillus horti TaxID=77523 RepID=A0ABT9VU76_9BACI|nr:purine-nucleoside phosphorylase [Bacillus horti]MDQ0164530.1 purine-nucleoside phosphorylase [Bacillus horti]